MFRSLLAIVVLAATVSAQKKPTFNVSSLPDKWEAGQIGTNQCKKYGASNQKSMCQNVFLNSADDFCLWAPVKKGTVGDQEEKMISWCTKSGYGTRLIPNGTLKGVHFVRTPDFIQITGQGDFTSMNIVRGDAGGELDPHGATGAGNPPGGIVYSRNVPGREGQWVQLKEWSNFMSATEFCFRACYPGKGNATKYCPHICECPSCVDGGTSPPSPSRESASARHPDRARLAAAHHSIAPALRSVLLTSSYRQFPKKLTMFWGAASIIPVITVSMSSRTAKESRVSSPASTAPRPSTRARRRLPLLTRPASRPSASVSPLPPTVPLPTSPTVARTPTPALKRRKRVNEVWHVVMRHVQVRHNRAPQASLAQGHHQSSIEAICI